MQQQVEKLEGQDPGLYAKRLKKKIGDIISKWRMRNIVEVTLIICHHSACACVVVNELVRAIRVSHHGIEIISGNP